MLAEPASAEAGHGRSPCGTKRVDRVQESIAADTIMLTTDWIAKLDNLPVAAGDHHKEEQMRLLERR